MGVSLILDEHRRIGIYSELLRYVISFTRSRGFQTIKSRHKATNNAIIIPKLKFGFFISGLELSDTMGTLVNLTYFHNTYRRELMNARSGLTRPTDKVRDLLVGNLSSS